MTAASGMVAIAIFRGRYNYMGGRVGPIRVGLFLGLISIFTITAQAINKTPSLSYEEALAEYLIKQAVDTINKVQMQDNIAYPINGIPVANKCVTFMDKEQVLGVNGKSIYDSFISLAPSFPNLVDGGTLNKYCPKYQDMQLEEKGLVWVLILTMVAQFESSCNSGSEAQGPNGTASGFYQLHKNSEARYDGKLSYCKKGSSTAASSVHQCTLAMLQYQFETQGNTLFSTKSYWDVLRPLGESQKSGHIRSALQKMHLCNPKIS